MTLCRIGCKFVWSSRPPSHFVGHCGVGHRILEPRPASRHRWFRQRIMSESRSLLGGVRKLPHSGCDGGDRVASAESKSPSHRASAPDDVDAGLKRLQTCEPAVGPSRSPGCFTLRWGAAVLAEIATRTASDHVRFQPSRMPDAPSIVSCDTGTSPGESKSPTTRSIRALRRRSVL